MRIGIIAERRIKPQNLLERYQREIISNKKNPFDLIIISIPYTAEDLDKIPLRRIKRAVLKAEKILKNLKADKIIFAALLKEYLGVLNNPGNQIFFTLIPQCIRCIAPKCRIFPPNCRICIRASKMDRIIEYLATELCYDTNRLIICTPDIHYTASFQERFYNETGFLAEITDECTADAEILIDLTHPSVRIGRDILIDGVQFDFDLGGCDVDFLEIASYIEGFDASKNISAYMMGKKKLTL